MSLPWKHAIVVGASSGMGEAIARQLASAGCHVGLVARRASALEALRTELNDRAGREIAVAIEHDVHNRSEVERLVQELTLKIGGLDLMVYAAGVMPSIAEDEYSTAKDEQIMEVNTLGAIAWLNEAARRFERTHRGTIIGIGSIAGDRGRRGNPVYGTSKAALATYLEALRNRLGRYGIKIVTVKPGFVDTSMTRGLPGLFWLISAEEAARQILDAARKGKNVAYIPARWRLVSWVVRSIPSFLFRRLGI